MPMIICFVYDYGGFKISICIYIYIYSMTHHNNKMQAVHVSMIVVVSGKAMLCGKMGVVPGLPKPVVN